MADPHPAESNIPVLTDIIRGGSSSQSTGHHETLIAELQTKLAARTFALADELLRTTFAQMQATLYEQVSAKLRERLPELIDSTLREQLDQPTDEPTRS